MATVDGKKEEFRQYLEKSGVIDALTKGMLLDKPGEKYIAVKD